MQETLRATHGLQNEVRWLGKVVLLRPVAAGLRHVEAEGAHVRFLETRTKCELGRNSLRCHKRGSHVDRIGPCDDEVKPRAGYGRDLV